MPTKKPAAKKPTAKTASPKARKPAKAKAKKPEGPRATSHEDVTGLCRQCKKPADHKHIGI